jgi:hypothetical protein
MDTLQEAGEKKAGTIMGTFPSRLPDTANTMADYEALSQLWSTAAKASTTRRAESRFTSKLNIVKRHVESCYEVWSLIRCDRLPRDESVAAVSEKYLAGDHDLVKPSPRRTESPSTKRSGKSDTDNLLMLGAKRDLATVWRDRLKMEDLVIILPLGDEVALKRLLISCAVCETGHKRSQHFM